MGTWPLMALMVAAGAGAAEQVLIRPDYGDAVAVAAAWQAGERTAPAEQVQRPDGPALRLPILFETNDSRRSYWDVPLSLDLTTARGLSFEVLCPDDSPVAYFNVYLRSGAGWYSRAWFTDSSGGWLRVNVLKAEMSTEDAPAGWGEISALRFSAWRAESADTELLVRNVALLGAPGPATRLAVVRQLGEVGGPYAQQMVGTLDSIGLEAVLIDEPDVTAARLAPFSVAILPNNPDLGEAAMDALEAFVVGGGRLFIAYSVPDRLRAMVGLPAAEYREQVRDGEFAQIVPRPGALPGAPVAVQASWNIAAPATTAGLEVLADWQDVEGQPSAAPALVASDRAVWLTHVWLPEGGPEREWLLLAALVHLEPQLDALAAEGLIARAMLIGPYAGYAQAAAVLAQRGGDPGALAGAESQLATARERLAVGDWAGARGQALAAGATARAAWAAAQPAEAGEWRVPPGVGLGGPAVVRGGASAGRPRLHRRGGELDVGWGELWAECAAACGRRRTRLHRRGADRLPRGGPRTAPMEGQLQLPVDRARVVCRADARRGPAAGRPGGQGGALALPFGPTQPAAGDRQHGRGGAPLRS